MATNRRRISFVEYLQKTGVLNNLEYRTEVVNDVTRTVVYQLVPRPTSHWWSPIWNFVLDLADKNEKVVWARFSQTNGWIEIHYVNQNNKAWEQRFNQAATDYPFEGYR